MDLSTESKQRKEFSTILYELSISQDRLQDSYSRANVYRRLEALYDAPGSEKGFRHFYSDIFSILIQIKQNPQLGNIDILGQNLDLIRNGYHPKNTAEDGHLIDISDSINKLYDHVNLEISRISYSDSEYWKLSGNDSFQNLQSQVNSVSDEIAKVQENAEEKIRNQQKEYVSILGIFAAVVLTFTGGLAFSTSVLENISQVSIYRILIVSLIIGLVLVNILFGLFYYINKIVSKQEKFKVLIISNVIIGALIFLVLASWLFGIVEFRNKRVNNLDIASFSQTESFKQKNNSLYQILSELNLLDFCEK